MGDWILFRGGIKGVAEGVMGKEKGESIRWIWDMGWRRGRDWCLCVRRLGVLGKEGGSGGMEKQKVTSSIEGTDTSDCESPFLVTISSNNIARRRNQTPTAQEVSPQKARSRSSINSYHALGMLAPNIRFHFLLLHTYDGNRSRNPIIQTLRRQQSHKSSVPRTARCRYRRLGRACGVCPRYRCVVRSRRIRGRRRGYGLGSRWRGRGMLVADIYRLWCW